MNIKDWIKKVEEEIKSIKKAKPKDRLAFTEAINNCNRTMIASTVGWDEWLKHSSVMNTFTKEELTEMHKEFQNIASIFLQFDVKWTKILIDKLNINEETTVEPEDCIENKEDKQKDTSYIS